MGKEIKIICDGCGIDVWGKRYFTLNIRKVASGKQQMHPAIYLCPKCFRETKLAMLLCDLSDNDGETNLQHKE